MNIVLDFDRTLFDTTKFSLWFAAQVAKRSGKSPETITQEAAKAYYVYQGDLYYYDMQAHMGDIFGNQAEAMLDEIQALAKTSENFLFDDVRRTLADLRRYGKVTILTFGEEQYQKFKISLCSELADVPAAIVQSAKGPHLAEQFEPSVRCVFVDDKDEHGSLPEWVEFYHLRRGLVETIDTPSTINSFDQLLQIVSLKESH